MKDFISSELSAPFSGGDWFDPLEEAVRFHVRGFIEGIVEEELAALGGRQRYQRQGEARGYRNGHRDRHLVGTFGPVTVSLPRARLHEVDGGEREWKSAHVPACKRLTKGAEAVIAGSYLAGTITRRVRRALAGLFGGKVGKDAVGRAWRKVKSDWEAWQARGLSGENIVRLILDGTGVKVRLDKRVTSIPLLVVIGVRRDAQKILLAVKNMGGETEAAWRVVLDDLFARGLRPPELVSAKRKVFLAKWRLRCRGVADSLEEAGDRLFTFLRYPLEQWRSLRTTNAVERLHEEFKRRIKTQCALPSAETAALLFWALVASGQITMRRVDGWQSLGEAPLNQPVDLAA